MSSVRKYSLFWSLSGLIVLLLILDWTSLPSEIFHPLFDVNAEANIPTWFSSIILLFISLCSFGIYIRSHNPRHKVFVHFWAVFALAYLYFSMDEVAGIHEFTYKIIERKSYRWVYLYFPFALALFLYCLAYFRFEKHTGPLLQNWILVGMFISALGGMGLELTHRYLFIHSFPVYVRHLEMTMEEGMEMTGAAMILQSCWLEVSSLFSTSPKGFEQNKYEIKNFLF